MRPQGAIWRSSGRWSPAPAYQEIADVVCGKAVRFDSAGGTELVTPEEKLDAWIDAVKKTVL